MRDSQARVDAIYAPYKSVLEDYMNKSGRWSFFNDDPNQGYKFHLNVKPENVRQVAAILKIKDYYHKYLNGGEIEDGKIFTVYTGSKEQTERIVRDVANSEILDLLEPPLGDRTEEILYAPNIAGRFVGNNQQFFTKIPIKGITILRGTEKLDKKIAFTLADKALQQRYGEYYGGGVAFYQPNKINNHAR